MPSVYVDSKSNTIIGAASSNTIMGASRLGTWDSTSLNLLAHIRRVPQVPIFGTWEAAGPHARSSLNACVHSFFVNPRMHHSMHSGSIARADSAFPMSAVSQPN